jgi:hypothetical protein
MLKFWKRCATVALSITTGIFTFVPETYFNKGVLVINISEQTAIMLNRLLTLVVVFVLTVAISAWRLHRRKHITIKGDSYSIQVEYGNLFEISDCKKVIAFDECFTTRVGDNPSDVNSDSVCGQFLQRHPIENIQSLIDNINLKPAKGKSKFQGKTKYEPGRLVPLEDYLLLSFAKLNSNGSGELTRDEFLECLSILWCEIEMYYGQKDVALPILGSGVTRMGDDSLTQQKLLDIIIASYKLSSHKIKKPYQLRIVCKKSDDFSLNKIGESV